MSIFIFIASALIITLGFTPLLPLFFEKLESWRSWKTLPLLAAFAWVPTLLAIHTLPHSIIVYAVIFVIFLLATFLMFAISGMGDGQSSIISRTTILHLVHPITLMMALILLGLQYFAFKLV